MSAAPEMDAERVARVLLNRGSVREAVALLRGAVARDAEEEGCAALLSQVLSGSIPEESTDGPALTLALVDRWIRRGMLVEALALLGGTAMGSDETGREWANLLGELLAPVPVDAENALVDMHRHLLTGGASVALTLLEERAQGEPALPAWASRRLSVLYWMLLDNAPNAESHPELSVETPSALSVAIRGAINGRDLARALESVRAYARAVPNDPDPGRVAAALTAIISEVGRHSDETGSNSRTLPMFGAPAAAMQLRMGNLTQACGVYRKILAKKPNDALALEMLEHTEAVLRAVRGEPVVPDWQGFDETTNQDARPLFLGDLDIPPTAVGDAPIERSKSGRTPVVLPLPEGVEDDDPEERAERYVLDGRLEEAESLYRRMAKEDPENRKWAERAEAVRAARAGETDTGVLVQKIRPVE